MEFLRPPLGLALRGKEMFGLDDLLATYAPLDSCGRDHPEVRFSEVTTDSRQCPADSLFVALPGDHHDGHDFIEEALGRGCRGALARSDRVAEARRDRLGARLYEWREARWICSGPDEAPAVLVLVPDSLQALQRLAGRWRSRFSPLVVGITGSVGKSTTKEVMAAVLEKEFATLKSLGSYNNEIGLPLTLLQLRPQHQVVVLEMGTYGPGEITLLAEIARPRVGVVTNVSHSHLERMHTLDTIAQAKSELPAALPLDGLAVLNGDEPLVRAMGSVSRAPVLYYGLGGECRLRATDVRSHGLEGISFQVRGDGEQRRLRCSLPGRHSVYSALPAVGVGRYLGMEWQQIEAGLLDPAARLRLLRVPGVGGSTLVDDTYNASPVSCRVALELLAELPGHRIAVFGDMLELGSFEEEGHRLVGEWAAGVVQELVVLGRHARRTGEAALVKGMPADRVHFAESHDEVVRLLKDRLGPDDVVLVKGSRGMEMERIVAALRQEEG